MSLMYCWFDWDDNTTTVNSINIIKEPRKPLEEYRKGDKILAKLPQFGMWNGVIVEISDSKKDLVQKMTERQKQAATNVETDGEKKDDSQEDLVQPKQTVANVEMNGEKKDTGRKKAAGKKRKCEDEDKMEEKRRQVEEAEKRMEARTIQSEEIIKERRNKVPPTDQYWQEDEGYTACPTQVYSSQSFPYAGPSVNQSSATFQPITDQYWHADPGYSYVGDLMSPLPQNSASFDQLESQRELKEKCARLELENAKLVAENKKLKEDLENLQQSQSREVITPRKVECLKQIVASFEKKKTQTTSAKQLFPTPANQDMQAEVVDLQTPTAVFQQTPCRAVTEAPTAVFQQTPCRAVTEPRAVTEQIPIGPEAVTEQTPERQVRSRHWEETVTASGLKKIQLVPCLDVYLTQAQLSTVKHVGANHPRKMTISLLDSLFTREELAQSSAKGCRKAHNAVQQSFALPEIAVQAIKQFVLNKFRKDTGEPCLSESVFNDIINAKCATARRALKR